MNVNRNALSFTNVELIIIRIGIHFMKSQMFEINYDTGKNVLIVRGSLLFDLSDVSHRTAYTCIVDSEIFARILFSGIAF